MLTILKIAGKNLMRYRRRTLLTSLMITISIMAVLLFISLAGSFKSLMVGQITDSMLGHIQIHRKGYLASIDNLPLNRNMTQKMASKIEGILRETEDVEAFSPRVKFGAMISNFLETSNIRINAVDPMMEERACPLLKKRTLEGGDDGPLVSEGKILIPEIISKGMKLKVGDNIVIVATNKDGSVNGNTFVISGVLEGISGPGGRDGYIHINDARRLLRMETNEVSEIAIRLKKPSKLGDVYGHLREELSEFKNKQGKPVFEVHTWKKLTPFNNIVKMMDIMNFFIKIMLISVVLISIMNVMIMAVYERVREIGTISAIGVKPGKILSLYVSEGLLLGILGTFIGTIISFIVIYALNIYKLTFSFGRQENLVLEPSIAFSDAATIAVIVIAVAAAASFQPAWKASRMDPIVALRHS